MILKIVKVKLQKNFEYFKNFLVKANYFVTFKKVFLFKYKVN